MNTAAVLLLPSPLTPRQIDKLHSRRLSHRSLRRYRKQIRDYIAMLDAVAASDYSVLAPYNYNA